MDYRSTLKTVAWWPFIRSGQLPWCAALSWNLTAQHTAAVFFLIFLWPRSSRGGIRVYFLLHEELLFVKFLFNLYQNEYSLLYICLPSLPCLCLGLGIGKSISTCVYIDFLCKAPPSLIKHQYCCVSGFLFKLGC